MDAQNTKPHPLLLDAVVDNLFKYCGTKQLGVCHKVCMTWNKAAKIHWQERSPMKFFKGDFCVSRISRHDTPEFKANLWSHAKLNKFYLEDFTFTESLVTNNTFWKTEGQSMRRLVIARSNILSANAFRELLYCEHTPNLQLLALEDVSFEFMGNERTRCVVPNDAIVQNPAKSMSLLRINYSETFRNLPFCWRVVFEGFPNLRELILHGYGTGENCELTRVFQGIHDFYIKHGYSHPLKKLIIGRKYGGETQTPFLKETLKLFRTILERQSPKTTFYRGLKLETLSFSVENPLDTLALFEFATYHSEELRRLEIFGNASYTEENINIYVPSENFNLPPMQNLTRLDIFECPVATLKFLLQLPSLMHLSILQFKGNPKLRQRQNIIRKDAPGWGKDEKLLYLSCPSMRSFHCNMPMDFEKEDLLRLSCWMPNITSLMIFVNDASFEDLCLGFQKLRRLLVYMYGVNDEIFTGMQSSPPLLAPISDTAEIQRRPNITDLKDLKLLGIIQTNNPAEDSNLKRNVRLTEFSATHGMLEMVTLQTVYLGDTFTEAGLQALDENGFGEKMEVYRSRNSAAFTSDFVRNF